MVSLFEKGDREDPVIYRRITLLNLYSRIINNCLLKYLELNDMLHERQADFRIGSCGIDIIFPLIS